MKTFPLSKEDNLICIGIGSTSLVSGIIMRCIPASWFSCFKFDESEDKEEDGEQISKSFIGTMRSSVVKKKKNS